MSGPAHLIYSKIYKTCSTGSYSVSLRKWYAVVLTCSNGSPPRARYPLRDHLGVELSDQLPTFIRRVTARHSRRFMPEHLPETAGIHVVPTPGNMYVTNGAKRQGYFEGFGLHTQIPRSRYRFGSVGEAVSNAARSAARFVSIDLCVPDSSHSPPAGVPSANTIGVFSWPFLRK